MKFYFTRISHSVNPHHAQVRPLRNHGYPDFVEYPHKLFRFSL
jgi:hypothetical protein